MKYSAETDSMRNGVCVIFLTREYTLIPPKVTPGIPCPGYVVSPTKYSPLNGVSVGVHFSKLRAIL